MQTPYDEDYFINGVSSGKSLYTAYRWLPELTIPMVKRMIEHLGIEKRDRILDFGCARGYIVKAFRELGYAAWGIDISDWAISNCDPEVRRFVRVDTEPREQYDWIVAKDVLEHITPHMAMTQQPHMPRTVGEVIHMLRLSAKKGVFVVVPLSAKNEESYVVPEYEKDVTHVVRWTLRGWVEACRLHCGIDPEQSVEVWSPSVGYSINSNDWEISARWRIKGIKDNYAQWEKGNGFITLRRI